jgi:hypothetical protein
MFGLFLCRCCCCCYYYYYYYHHHHHHHHTAVATTTTTITTTTLPPLYYYYYYYYYYCCCCCCYDWAASMLNISSFLLNIHDVSGVDSLPILRRPVIDIGYVSVPISILETAYEIGPEYFGC